MGNRCGSVDARQRDGSVERLSRPRCAAIARHVRPLCLEVSSVERPRRRVLGRHARDSGVGGIGTAVPIFGYVAVGHQHRNDSVDFLMVFIIQNTINRDSVAMHLKLDELLRVTAEARSALIGSELLGEKALEDLQEQEQRPSPRRRSDPLPPRRPSGGPEAEGYQNADPSRRDRMVLADQAAEEITPPDLRHDHDQVDVAGA
jgi:low affinity iron permease